MLTHTHARTRDLERPGELCKYNKRDRDKDRGRNGGGWREGGGEKSCPQKEEKEPGRSNTRQRERLKETQKKVSRNRI